MGIWNAKLLHSLPQNWEGSPLQVRQGWKTMGFPVTLQRQRIRPELSVGRGIGEEAEVKTSHISYSTHHGVTCVCGVRSSVLH